MIDKELILQQPVLLLSEVKGILGVDGFSNAFVNSELIQLRRSKNKFYPTFQFDLQNNDLYKDVRKINNILGARKDPWKTADWWYTNNKYKLLGTDKSYELVKEALGLFNYES